MKKLTMLAVLAALATSAHAASVAWGFGGLVYLYDGKTAALSTESTATVDPGAYLALVYLGQNVESYSLSDLTKEGTTAKVVDQMSYSITTTGKSSAIGKWNPTGQTYDDTAMKSGASFTVLFYNGSSFDYVYALSGTDKGAAKDSNILTITNADMTTADGTIFATGGSTTAGVVAVPEPSTAMLALAGLALLIKRRRA